MKEKKQFGHSNAELLSIGDIVSWTKFSTELNDWVEYYGILSSIENEVHANRLVSVSRVIPLENSSIELSFFTITLRLVSQASETYKENKT